MAEVRSSSSPDVEDTASGLMISAESQSGVYASTAAAVQARLRDLARWSFIAGAGLCCLAVMAGAFGAHALRNHVSSDLLAIFETGARYQMYHGLALLALALAAAHHLLGVRSARWSFGFILTGTLIFSSSLYLLTLTGVRTWGAVTPMGGVLQILGWITLVVGVWRNGIPRQTA